MSINENPNENEMYKQVSEIYKDSNESNSIALQTNEASTLLDLKTRAKATVRVIQALEPPRKIKYFYSDPSLVSYTRRPSQKPNYMFEKKIDTIQVDTPQISDIYITNVQKKDNMTGPRTFENVIESNVLNIVPAIEREFDPRAIVTFSKIGKNNDLNFIENKAKNTDIEIPVVPTISNKTIFKRL